MNGNTKIKQDSQTIEIFFGEGGYMLLDIEKRTIHCSKLFENGVKGNKKFTTVDFGDFCVFANELFQDAELLYVIEQGLYLHQGIFDGVC